MIHNPPSHSDTCLFSTVILLFIAHFPADSVEDAQKWLDGLELLRQETLAAPTPVIVERYTHTHAFTQLLMTKTHQIIDLCYFPFSCLRKQMYSVNQTKTNRYGVYTYTLYI